MRIRNFHTKLAFDAISFFITLCISSVFVCICGHFMIQIKSCYIFFYLAKNLHIYTCRTWLQTFFRSICSPFATAKVKAKMRKSHVYHWFLSCSLSLMIIMIMKWHEQKNVLTINIYHCSLHFPCHYIY